MFVYDPRLHHCYTLHDRVPQYESHLMLQAQNTWQPLPPPQPLSCDVVLKIVSLLIVWDCFVVLKVTRETSHILLQVSTFNEWRTGREYLNGINLLLTQSQVTVCILRSWNNVGSETEHKVYTLWSNMMSLGFFCWALLVKPVGEIALSLA